MPPKPPQPPPKPYFFYGHRKSSQNRPTVYGGFFSNRYSLKDPDSNSHSKQSEPIFDLQKWDPHYLPSQNRPPRSQTPSLSQLQRLSPIARFIVDSFRKSQSGWGPEVVAQLNKLRRVTPDLVAEVLKVENNPVLASRFFHWAGKQKGYRHTFASYNALTYCLNRNKLFRAADQVPELMDSQGKPPTEKQFEILIRMHADCGRGLRVNYVYQKMKKFGLVPSVFLYNRIMDALVKTSYLDLALSVYDDFKAHELVEESITYMILIKGLCKEGRFEEMFELLGKMRDNLCKPDYEFCKEDIILLWMAEGFFQTDCSEKQKEDLGKEYFEDLHSRSFFQQSSNNTSSFVMHDLIHDLAQWAAKDICFRIENLHEGEKQWKIPKHIRHLSYLIDKSNYSSFKKSGAFNEMKSMRTFLALSPYYWIHDNSNDLLLMLLQLRRMKVLSLYRYPFSKLPNSIGDMKLLHYLELSESVIKFLPDSINKLYNLEALILKDCDPLKRLCSDMGNLIKLRHLNVSNSHQLEAMPLRIGKLTSLRTLQRFVVGEDMRSGLRELKDLTHLQERLHISGLENVNDFWDVEKANLNGKEGLKDMQLEWTRPSNEQIATEVLEKLQPCQTLKSLEIRGYGGTQFPPWLGDTSLLSLVSLTFDDCKNCVFLNRVTTLT